MTLEDLARKVIEAEKDLAAKSRASFESREAAEWARRRLERLIGELCEATERDEFILVDGVGVFPRDVKIGRAADGSRTVRDVE